MTKCIGATVKDGFIKVEAPPDWPDGTEVRVDLVCRSGLTAEDSLRTGAEMSEILDRMAEAKRGSEDGSPEMRK